MEDYRWEIKKKIASPGTSDNKLSRRVAHEINKRGVITSWTIQNFGEITELEVTISRLRKIRFEENTRNEIWLWEYVPVGGRKKMHSLIEKFMSDVHIAYLKDK